MPNPNTVRPEVVDALARAEEADQWNAGASGRLRKEADKLNATPEEVKAAEEAAAAREEMNQRYRDANASIDL